MARDTAVISPNLGLYLGRSPLTVPLRGLSDGRNFRIEEGRLTNANLGWELYTAFDFQNPVTLIDTFVIRGGAQKQIIGTTRDLFDYDPDGDDAVYINPTYSTGTVSLGGNDTFTKVLLSFPGADASTTFTDSNAGGSAHTWAGNDGAQIDTAQSKFGGSSLLLDGTNDFIQTSDISDFPLGTSDFAIDFWVRFNASTAGQVFIEHGIDANNWWRIRSASDSSLTFEVRVAGVTTTLVRNTTDFISTGVWYHVAIVRSGNQFEGYVDGVSVGGGTTNSISIATMSSVLRIGSDVVSALSSPLNGWLDEFRFSIGTPRWNSAFTPPIAPYASALTVTGVGTLWTTVGVQVGGFIHFGSTSETDPLTTWYEIATIPGETTLTLVNGPALTPSSALYTIRFIATGGVEDIWETATFVAPDDGTGDDLWFATNGTDYPLTWDGNASAAISQSDLGFKCKELNVYKNMMIYANLVMDGGDARPTSFINSDIQKPLDVTNGLAGEFRAHSGTDQILTLSNLGDNLAIYSEETITLIQFVGDPLIFVFRDVSNGVGLLASRLHANFGDYHEFLSTDSQYLFDGATINEIGKQVWREVLNNRDQTRKHLGHTHFSEERGELHWIVPLTLDGAPDADTEASNGFIEHYLEEVGDRVPTPYSHRASPWLCSGYGITGGALTFDEVSDTWADTAFRWNDNFLFSAFPISLMGASDNHVYKINGTQLGGGTPLVSYVTTNRRALGDGRMRGLLTRVYPFAEQANLTLDVTVRLCDHAEGEITTSETLVFDTTLNEGEYFVSPFRVGRYFELQFGTNGTSWTMSGYDTDIRRGGFR